MNAEAIRARTPAAVLLGGFAAVLLAFAAARAQVAEVPYLTGRITDNAEILSPRTRDHVAMLIKAHEEASTNQLAVLTMPSLQGVGLEKYAARVFQTWKLGEKGKDNGVLLLVSPADRRIRIEVGSGLRAKLSDASAGRIIRDLMAPRFEEDDFDSGIAAGVHAIISSLEGNEQPENVPPEGLPAEDEPFFEGPDLSITERILIGSFIFGIIGLFTVIGVLTPGVGWFLYLFLIPFWAMFPIVVVGTRGALILLVTYLIGFPAAKLVLAQAQWYRRAKEDLKRKGVAQIGGFTVTGGGASSSSWSSR